MKTLTAKGTYYDNDISAVEILKKQPVKVELQDVGGAGAIDIVVFSDGTRVRARKIDKYAAQHADKTIRSEMRKLGDWVTSHT